MLNKINLNKNYITNIGAEWANKIATTTWKVGGNSYTDMKSKPAKTVYQYEIVSPVTKNTTDNATTYSTKIGLMYASDYMFAVPQDKWTLIGYRWGFNKTDDYSTATSVNWMHMGLDECTIFRGAYDAYHVFIVRDAGRLDDTYANGTCAVRPVFNLISSTTYVSGVGTKTKPIRIN